MFAFYPYVNVKMLFYIYLWFGFYFNYDSGILLMGHDVVLNSTIDPTTEVT